MKLLLSVIDGSKGSTICVICIDQSLIPVWRQYLKGVDIIKLFFFNYLIIGAHLFFIHVLQKCKMHFKRKFDFSDFVGI